MSLTCRVESDESSLRCVTDSKAMGIICEEWDCNLRFSQKSGNRIQHERKCNVIMFDKIELGREYFIK